MSSLLPLLVFFFFIETATTEIYTLSLHDALPIYRARAGVARAGRQAGGGPRVPDRALDRKSTRLNSSHRCISYAVFCLKKKTSKAPIRARRRSRLARPSARRRQVRSISGALLTSC